MKTIQREIKTTVFIAFLCMAIPALVGYFYTKNKKEIDYRAIKNYRVILRWLENRNAKKSVGEYLERHNYNSFAVYGVGEMGKILLDELKQVNKFPEYIIERNSLYQPDFGVSMISYNEIGYMEEVDVVIITPIHIFMEIENNLRSAGYQGKIISLEDIIFEK